MAKLKQKADQWFRVSWSRIKSWKRCRKQHHYKYVERLEAKRKPPALLRGKLLGQLIEAHCSGQNWKTLWAKLSKEHRTLFSAEVEMYGDFKVEIPRIMEGYVKRYGKEKTIALEHEEFLELAPGILLSTRNDGILIEDGKKWLKETKTHRNIPDEETRFSDLQTVIYYALLKAKYKLSGVIWDYVRTKPPTVPQQLKDGGLSKRNIESTPEVYLSEIKRLKLNPADYEDILSELKEKEDNFYLRVKLPEPSQHLIDATISDFTQTAQFMRDHPDLQDRNMGRDCPRCEFYALCQAELRGLDSHFIRKSEFKIQPEGHYDGQESSHKE